MKVVSISNKIIALTLEDAVTRRILNNSDERNQQIKQYILDHPEKYYVGDITICNLE